MNTIGQKILYFAFLLFLSDVFFVSCGLDTTYSLTEPAGTNNTPSYTSSDESSNYFDFTTADSQNISLESSSDGSFRYLGTAIYYKIYNNYSTMLSQYNAIISVNTSSNGSAAATKMIDTYTFQQLGSKTIAWTPFINRSDVAVKSDRRVRFRLKNINSTTSSSYYSSETVAIISKNYGSGWYAGISESGEETYFTYDSSTDEWTDNSSSETFSIADKYPDYFIIPCRYDNERTFDFFDDNDDDDDEYDVEPESGDDDYYYSSTASADDTYYVLMFAVAVGRDTTDYSMSYSLVCYLGSVAIAK